MNNVREITCGVNMIKMDWDIDDQIQIHLDLSAFGKASISVNGRPHPEKIKLKNKKPHEFGLDDGRKVSLVYTTVGFAPEFELKVNGELMLPNGKEFEKICASCQTKNKPNDKFCTSCGGQLVSSENQIRKNRVGGARQTIHIMVGIFAVSGVLLFFVQQSAVNQAMANLAQHKDTDVYPQAVEGKRTTVGELKQSIVRQQWSVLILNLGLAGLMLGLGYWAKSAPLPAIMVAAAVYGVVQVANALVDPRTIGQGWIMKVIVITLLVKGIRSALELRHSNESV
jgi:hypothetical protein